MDWITNTTALVSLITGLMGLLTAAVTAYISIKKVIKANKEKSLKEIWSLIMELADAAILEAERSGLNGLAKKDMVINCVNVSAKVAGIDITPFTEQLSLYIDSCVGFANTFNKKENN